FSYLLEGLVPGSSARHPFGGNVVGYGGCRVTACAQLPISMVADLLPPIPFGSNAFGQLTAVNTGNVSKAFEPKVSRRRNRSRSTGIRAFFHRGRPPTCLPRRYSGKPLLLWAGQATNQAVRDSPVSGAGN